MKILCSPIHSIYPNAILAITLLLLWMPGFVGNAHGAAQEHPLVLLSPDEKAYINQGAAQMVYDPLWPPFDFRDSKGNHAGMAAELLRLVTAKTGLRIKPLHTASWAETMELVRTGQFDMVSLLNDSESRKGFLTFTSPLLEEPLVIVTQSDNESMTLNSLTGKLTLVQGYYVAESIKNDYPDIPLTYAMSTEDSLRMVRDGVTQATIMTEIEATHLIRKHHWYNLKIAGETPYSYSLCIGVRKDNRLLLSILQKAVDAMSPSEKDKILSKWLADPEIADESGILYYRVFGTSLFALIIGIIFYRMVVSPRRQ